MTVQRYDEDGSGEIEFEEFSNMVQELLKAHVEGKFRQFMLTAIFCWRGGTWMEVLDCSCVENPVQDLDTNKASEWQIPHGQELPYDRLMTMWRSADSRLQRPGLIS